ncbi:MAG: copper chaperone [Cytophagales bacterium]|nr:MAG: copper chaperone [Cytophagales bacterium]
MKTISNVIAAASLLVITTFCNSNAQTTKVKFKVFGNCEMCKKTIETALDVKGVKSANWSTESKMIEIAYQADKISESKLHELIAASGYDTEKSKGNDKAYSNLPGCCQYTRK